MSEQVSNKYEALHMYEQIASLTLGNAFIHYTKCIDLYGICPVLSARSPHPSMMATDRTCIQEACAVWNGKKCGLVKGQG